MAPTNRQTRFDESVDFLYGVYPKITETNLSLNGDWDKCRLYVPQVFALEKLYRESESPLIPRAEFATVLGNAAWFLFNESLPHQAMQLLPTARAVGEATLAGNEFTVSMIYRCLGKIYLDANKAEAAFDNFYRQMQVMQDLGAGYELPVAVGLHNCGLAKMCSGEYEESRDYLTQAQHIRRAYFGQVESYEAFTLNVRGILYGMEGWYDDAITNINAAIAAFDQELGVRNHFTAFAQYSLGNVYIHRGGDYGAAFLLHSMALSTRRELLGDTYRTAPSLHKVAWLLYQRREYECAEEMLLPAFAIFSNSYEGKGGVGRSSYLMSMILEALGRGEEARETKKFAASVREEILGIPPDEDDTLESYDKLVGALDR